MPLDVWLPITCMLQQLSSEALHYICPKVGIAFLNSPQFVPSTVLKSALSLHYMTDELLLKWHLINFRLELQLINNWKESTMFNNSLNESQQWDCNLDAQCTWMTYSFLTSTHYLISNQHQAPLQTNPGTNKQIPQLTAPFLLSALNSTPSSYRTISA